MKKHKLLLKDLFFSFIKCSILAGVFYIFEPKNKDGISNALFLSGFAFTTLAILVLVFNEGVFDLFVYGTKRLFTRNNLPRDPYEYITSKHAKKNVVIHTFIVGLLFLIAAYLFLI